MKKLFPVLLTAALLVGPACGSRSDPDVLVRDAILHYLSNRTNLSMGKMDVRLDSVEYQGDQATAAVTITARDDSQARMHTVYKLNRTRGGWEVDPGASSTAGGAHGGGISPGGQGSGSGLPPGHPPAGGASGGDRSRLPEGHPSVGEKTTGEKPSRPNPKLPEGHPPVPAR